MAGRAAAGCCRKMPVPHPRCSADLGVGRGLQGTSRQGLLHDVTLGLYHEQGWRGGEEGRPQTLLRESPPGQADVQRHRWPPRGAGPRAAARPSASPSSAQAEGPLALQERSTASLRV